MMSETQSCQNCKTDFSIEPEDFAFYEKMKVPPPTWCPQCRLIRRLSFMNERTLYNRTCDLCHKKIIATFSAETPYVVYCAECWNSDAWDPMEYGVNIDFSKSFFHQLQELFRTTPQRARQMTALTNSDYCAMSGYLKNCYLVFNSGYSEDSLYCAFLERGKECLDLYVADLCERCYDSSNIFKDYNVRYSKRCNECMNVSFSYNLQNCSDCFGCANLKNKQYYIFNTPYSREEYEASMRKFDHGSYFFVEEMKKKIFEMMLKYPRRYAEGLNNENVSGDYIFNSKNASYCCEVTDCENCKWCHFISIAASRDSYDFTMWGGGAERMYECMGAGGGAYDVKFCSGSWNPLLNCEYLKETIKGNSDCFGCFGIRKKQYCILNKQCTKAEYETLVPKIKQHMNDMPYVDSVGRIYRYGEFFPVDLSPYAYNETLAHALFPLSKEEALKQGYHWRDVELRNMKSMTKSSELPDHIKDAPDTITSEVIECQHRGERLEQCPGAFKITSQELAFYREMSIPLPRLCHNCRHYSRLSARNPISQLWSRQCQCGGERSTNGVYKNSAPHVHGTAPCSSIFQTSYAPERPDIVYCAECYQQEVV